MHYIATAEYRHFDDVARRAFSTRPTAQRWIDSLDPEKYHPGTIEAVTDPMGVRVPTK